jgi:hypothetical protein
MTMPSPIEVEAHEFSHPSVADLKAYHKIISWTITTTDSLLAEPAPSVRKRPR